MQLGELIKAKRESEGLSLREFAERCNLSHSYVKNLEEADPRTGKNVAPTIETLEKLAPAMGMSLEELLKEVGYISGGNRFEPSNLRLIRGNKTYTEISEDIYRKTGNKINPSVYEALEEEKSSATTPLFIDTLARYAGVDRSFFYKRNSTDTLEYTRKNLPYQYQNSNSEFLSHIKDRELTDFIKDPANGEYLILAKELHDKKLKVKLIRDIIFNE